MKLIGQESGKQVLVDPNSVGGANVVLSKVPCETSVYVGAAVIMQASGIAKNALADSEANSNVIGIVESKPSVAECDIRVLGTTADIFAGLDVSKEYYLSATVAGGVTISPPTATGNIMLRVGQPFSATEMLVNKGQRIVRT